MSRLRQRALTLIAALALSAPAVGASTTPPRAIDNPPPAAASQAVQDLVIELSQGVSDVQATGRERVVGKRKRAKLSKAEAIGAARTSKRLNDWLADHAIAKVKPTFDAAKGLWTVAYISKRSNGTEVTQAEVLVRDETSEVSEVRTGPQVAWMMARGYKGAFGRGINRPAVWLTLCALFLVAMVDWRRPFSMRTLDLTVLLSLGISLIWFNDGEIFTSVPLQYPPLAYLAVRLGWLAFKRSRPVRAIEMEDVAVTQPRRPRVAGGLPTWALATLLVVTLGLRFGLNAFDSNVIDVGYAGVIGADRIVDGKTPYGTFPNDCGRCDTYGPLNYLTYVPFELAMPWKGKWDDLGAAHGAAVLFDVIAVLGMMALGWILSGARLAVALALAWSAFPFTAYALESNSNDSLVAAMLIWGLVAARRPFGRGVLLGLALATKFAPAVLLPLWSRSPFPRARSQGRLAFLAGLCTAALLTGWVLFLDGLDGVRAFWSRTLGYQFGRDSPFSIWGQYPALRPLQIALLGLVVLAALAVFRFPKRMDLVQFAAISGALMIGMQLTLTHWFYLYIPWFIPFAILVVVPDWPSPAAVPRRAEIRHQVSEAPAGAWSPA